MNGNFQLVQVTMWISSGYIFVGKPCPGGLDEASTNMGAVINFSSEIGLIFHLCLPSGYVKIAMENHHD